MNNSAPGTTFFSGSVFAMQLSARFWRVHMSWKFIYILLLLHAPTRLWIWLLGLAFSWGRWRLKLKGGPCLAGGGWLHWFSSQWNDSRKWELDQHLFCNRFGSFFWFPSVDSSLVRFFFPAIFIFLDRMLLSSQQEQYLTLKHVKLLPRLLAASCIPRFWDVEGSIMTWKSHQRASKLVIAN